MNKMDFLKNKICWVERDNKIITHKNAFLSLTNYENTTFRINDAFDKADWTKEPTKSLKQLYKERAQQLRDDYDYLIVYFSGGSDSITMVNAFLNNNIKIDEIVINSFPQINKDVLNCNYAKEYLKLRSFQNKITINNIDMNMLNEINRKQIWFKDERNNFSGLLPGLTRCYIDFFEENNLNSLTRRTGKIGHVFGAEFPKIKTNGKQYYCCINQMEFTNFGLHENSIPFFIPVELPEVFIKQCHVLARYMHVTKLYKEQDCKIVIRDEFTPKMFSAKTSGNPNNQFLAGSESRLILTTYLHDHQFKDLYSNSLYKDYLKPRMNKNIKNLDKRFFLFEV